MSNRDNPGGVGTPDWAEYEAREVEWEYSSRDVTCQPIRYLGGADTEFAQEWLGADVSEEDLHALAGVPLGARLTVSGVLGHLAISAIGQARTFSRDGEEVIVRYESLVHIPMSVRSGGMAAQVLKFHYCTSKPGRTGFGTDAIARMVSVCETLEFVEIEGLLAGDAHDETELSTGYYVWPSQGFDADLSEWVDRENRPLPDELRTLPSGEPVESLQDLFDVPGGPEWWRQNGSTIAGKFLISPGSPSRLQLQMAVDKLARQRRKP